jgi:hypothetical protein
MNKQFLWALSALAVMTLCMSGAMAFTQDVMIKSTDGGVSPTFSMTIASGDVTIPLSVGTNEKTNGPLVDISSNTAYTISAFSSIYGQPAPSLNKMAAFNGATYTGGYLADTFQVGVTGDAYKSITETTQVLRTGSAEVFSQPLKFKQVVSVLDPVLPAGNTYQIGITVTGAATP